MTHTLVKLVSIIESASIIKKPVRLTPSNTCIADGGCFKACQADFIGVSVHMLHVVWLLKNILDRVSKGSGCTFPSSTP